jgi:hypothetical protein
VPGLDLIPLEWLHLTMQGVGFTDEVSLNDARAIAEAVATRFANLAPLELTFHSPVIRPEAIALPPGPREALAHIATPSELVSQMYAASTQYLRSATSSALT